jgi:ABC-type antimicrobial peptide transport system permease subunit
VIGIGLSFAIAILVQAVFPTLLIMILPDWILRASLLALFSGIFGSLYPSFRAAGQDPVEALAYE